jgi:hypothetical protein
MFEMRLGLALGKSRSEIRELPAPEYHDWQLFYMIEPWGWVNTEQQVSRILAMLLNLKVKKNDRKQPSYFIRNVANDIINQIEAQRMKQIELKRLDSMTREEKRAYLIPIIKRDMGVK